MAGSRAARSADPWSPGAAVSPSWSGDRRLGAVGADWDGEERAALVALLRARPERLSWPEITALVAEAGSAREVWSRTVTGDLFDPIADDHPMLVEARADVCRWESASFDFLTFMDGSYPSRLRDVHQMPPVVFSYGRFTGDDVGVCVVGSRDASDRGVTLATDISRGLAERSLSVVSGLALGIDTAAHRAAMEAGGRTVAVIGTGIERCYPAANASLQQRIGEDGFVLSQFWPSAPPTKHSFPMRNAVMSAYGRATIVIEAGETSGARIQARLAVEHGRPVLLFQTVVDSTSWGQAMVDNPGVSVIRTAEHALDAVSEILESEAQVDRWLTLAKQ